MSESPAEGIIAHMNKDHKLALEDYLFVYGNVPITDKIAHVRMLAIELDHMVLQFNHFDVEFEIEKTILFEPPLADWKEARERLVGMAKDAAAKRGFSHIQINEMSYPNSIGEYLLIFLVMMPPVCYFNRSLLQWVPVVGAWLDNDALLLTVFVATVVCHFAECILLLKPKLDFYRVPTDFLIEWYLFGLLEGYPAVKRLNQLVKEKTL